MISTTTEDSDCRNLFFRSPTNWGYEKEGLQPTTVNCGVEIGQCNSCYIQIYRYNLEIKSKSSHLSCQIDLAIATTDTATKAVIDRFVLTTDSMNLPLEMIIFFLYQLDLQRGCVELLC
jgi:hypothetical protein